MKARDLRRGMEVVVGRIGSMVLLSDRIALGYRAVVLDPSKPYVAIPRRGLPPEYREARSFAHGDVLCAREREVEGGGFEWRPCLVAPRDIAGPVDKVIEILRAQGAERSAAAREREHADRVAREAREKLDARLQEYGMPTRPSFRGLPTALDNYGRVPNDTVVQLLDLLDARGGA